MPKHFYAGIVARIAAGLLFLGGFLARLAGGSLVAGFVGSTLAFIWPIVFYMNIRTGSLFLQPAILVDELEDVTERTINALLWGKTFAIGAIVNSLVAIVVSYFLFLLIFERVRTPTLKWLRKRVRYRKALRNRH